MTIQTMLNEYGVNVAHVRHVSSLALTLFDQVRQKHNLPRKARHLLEVGALLHDVGMTTDPKQHHIVGRDIVLHVDFPTLDADARAIVACLVSFHRKKVRATHEPAYLRLSKKDRDIALRLAALLRVADGLDYSHTQSTHLRGCKVSGKQTGLRLVGPHTHEDAPRAEQKADLWRKVLSREFAVVADEEPGTMPETMKELIPAGETMPETTQEPVPTGEETATPAPGNGKVLDVAQSLPALDDPTLLATPPVAFVHTPSSSDPQAETCLRLLRQAFRDMLSRERGGAEDRDPEDVHKMRVATRRLRAILPIAAEVAPAKPVRAASKHFKQLARLLGDVRDCDVFLGHVQHYTEQHSVPAESNLVLLTNALQRDRAVAREKLLAHLESPRYERFKSGFAAFITDTTEEWNMVLRVRDRLGSIIWQRYEALRAYETGCTCLYTPVASTAIDSATEEHLHEARIAGKRLRYALELFGAILGDEAKHAIAPLSHLQDCLGGVQDIATAREYIATPSLQKHSRQPESALAGYLAHRERERETLLAQLPERWQHITGDYYRRTLAELLYAL